MDSDAGLLEASGLRRLGRFAHSVKFVSVSGTFIFGREYELRDKSKLLK